MAYTEEDFTIFLLVWFLVPIVVLLIFLLTRIRVVEKGFGMVVERCGRFDRVAKDGCTCLVPFVERARPLLWRQATVVEDGGSERVEISQAWVDEIDMRTDLMDFPSQPIITRDNVKIMVHPALFYHIVDVQRAVYETFDLDHAVEKLVQTALRSIIGDMSLDDALASREEIERALELKVKSTCYDWGLEIESCELLEISPTPAVQDAMHQQLRAERLRRASIVTAEGQRQKEKTEAEGVAQKQIAIAQGEERCAVIKAQASADARISLARAEADSVTVIAAALKPFGIDSTGYIIGMKYVEALERLGTSAASRVVYLPFAEDVAGTAGHM